MGTTVYCEISAKVEQPNHEPQPPVSAKPLPYVSKHNLMFRKHLLFPTLLSAGLGLGLFSCGSDTETVKEPTEGVVTTLTEVSPGDFRIVSETAVPRPEDSRIILNKMDSTTQVITLTEAQAMLGSDSTRYSQQQRSAVRRSSGGFFFFMMYNRMGGHTPRAGSYVNSQAYNRSAGVGSSLNNSARTTTRTRSGFGSKSSGSSSRSTGSSSRSFGG